MRVIAFCIVALSAFFTPFPIAVGCALLYAFWYSGYELIFLGACVDAQFSILAMHTFYWYTCSFALLIIISLIVRPYLNVHTPHS